MLGIVLWFGDTWVEMRFFLLALVWPRALPCATTAVSRPDGAEEQPSTGLHYFKLVGSGPLSTLVANQLVNMLATVLWVVSVGMEVARRFGAFIALSMAMAVLVACGPGEMDALAGGDWSGLEGVTILVGDEVAEHVLGGRVWLSVDPEEADHTSDGAPFVELDASIEGVPGIEPEYPLIRVDLDEDGVGERDVLIYTDEPYPDECVWVMDFGVVVPDDYLTHADNPLSQRVVQVSLGIGVEWVE